MKIANVYKAAAWACQAAMGGLALLSLAGCLTSPKIEGGAAAYSAAPLPDAEVVPVNLDPSRRTRVVVLPSNESPSSLGAGLADVASAELETVLGAGGIEVVDRKMASRLDQELKLAEIKGSGTYGGPEVADYAIRVVMGNAGWSSNFVQPSTKKNILTGKQENVPGGHEHVGTSVMTLRIYTLPSLKLVEALPVDGSVSFGQKPAAATQQANGVDLMRNATATGIRSKRAEVLNEFQPKGYITERRVKEKVSIFRVQLGKNTGAKRGNEVQIWTLQKVGNGLDEVNLGKGVVSDVVGADGSWIVVSDEQVAARVRKGDYVKVRVSSNPFSLPTSLGDLLK